MNDPARAAIADISKNVGELLTTIDSYAKNTDRVLRRTAWYMGLFLAALVSLVIGVVVWLAT